MTGNKRMLRTPPKHLIRSHLGQHFPFPLPRKANQEVERKPTFLVTRVILKWGASEIPGPRMLGKKGKETKMEGIHGKVSRSRHCRAMRPATSKQWTHGRIGRPKISRRGRRRVLLRGNRTIWRFGRGSLSRSLRVRGRRASMTSSKCCRRPQSRLVRASRFLSATAAQTRKKTIPLTSKVRPRKQAALTTPRTLQLQRIERVRPRRRSRSRCKCCGRRSTRRAWTLRMLPCASPTSSRRLQASARVSAMPATGPLVRILR
mmetsp:Transcript_37506/g.88262  ORF Transcript_37506/g.88262 Transcript_37506/m.88262 type:complete len:261 (+) Transcript_37506:319-1101(+)